MSCGKRWLGTDQVARFILILQNKKSFTVLCVVAATSSVSVLNVFADGTTEMAWNDLITNNCQKMSKCL